MNNGKKITIFLADGLPKGIRHVKIDQWSGKAVSAPRNRFRDLILESVINNAVCVYFLIGLSEENSLPKVYVGEADGFGNRVKGHDSLKDWWQEVVVFFSYGDSLNKASIKYLESLCCEQLKKAGKCILQNANTPAKPTIPFEDVSGLRIFYEHITLIMPLLGYDVFVQDDLADKTRAQELLYCEGKGVTAQGILLKDGKIRVLKGSGAVAKNVNSFDTHFYNQLKNELINMGRLVKDGNNLKFQDDYVFDSTSAAAAIILARSSSGPVTWKTKDGKTLKEVLEKQLH